MPARDPGTGGDRIDRRARGAAVEAAARRLLEQAGLATLAANAGCRGGELDLVMRQGQMLVFVEVRYRASKAFGGALASVDAGKRRRLVRAAQAYLLAHPQYASLPCRFDLVQASGDPQAPRLHWLRDAFRLDGA